MVIGSSGTSVCVVVRVLVESTVAVDPASVTVVGAAVLVE